ncbi:MAG: sporulation protein YqfD [Clostridia bacterium]|nr:sporulation protein YqfD [Clostridia bacterium]
MASLNELVFGYRKGKVEPKDMPKLTSIFLKLGITSSITPDGLFTIPEKDSGRFTAYAGGRIRFTLSEPLGVPGFFIRGRKRYGLIFALILICVIYFLSSGLVWDVRVSGNETLSDQSIIDSLEQVGLGVGTSWRETDNSAIENELLMARNDIAWVSVVRRGTVAYVRIIETENVTYEQVPVPSYSNVIADRDGVIEEITVKSGVAAVKVGDVVREGDVLISGVVETERGVIFCRAEGCVRAKAVADVSVLATREIKINEPSDTSLAYVRAVLFKFSINIFKNYRNHENNCDIIEEIRNFTLFGGYKLPFKLEKGYYIEYSEATYTRTEEEMTKAARMELETRINTEFRDADILKLRTTGEFCNDGYRITSRVVYATEIGKESVIEVN